MPLPTRAQKRAFHSARPVESRTIGRMDTITAQFHVLWAQLAVLLPRIVAALAVLFAGWLVAAVLRRLTVRLLRKARIDDVAERAGIDGFLVQGGIRFTAVTLVAWFLYWLLILSAVSLAFSIVGISAADEMMRRTMLYIPKVIVAALIVGFGALFARVVRGMLSAYLNNVGVEGARAISAVAQYALLAFVVTMALEQLDIGGETLTAAFEMAFGGCCLAFGLAFGLGGRRWAQALLERIWKP